MKNGQKKTLLILRHAKSDWKAGDLEDHDRPLNKKGMKSAPLVGKFIKENHLIPDLILTSSALRAKSTAFAVSEECGFEGRLEIARDLYLATPEVWLKTLGHVNNNYRRVMIVGHNPGLKELVFQLTRTEQELPTTALAQVDLDIEDWLELDECSRGELVTLWKPSKD